MNKLLILGANSTGGGYASYYFSKKGYEVISSSRSNQAHKAQLPYLFKKCPYVKYVTYDINWETASQVELINSINPEYVINFASQSMVAQAENLLKTGCGPIALVR